MNYEMGIRACINKQLYYIHCSYMFMKIGIISLVICSCVLLVQKYAYLVQEKSL